MFQEFEETLAAVETEPQLPAEWTPEQRALYAAKRLGELEREEAEAKAYLAAAARRIEQRREYYLAQYGADLRAFIATQARAGAKSVNTPYGRLGLRSVGGGITITDEAKAVEWAAANAPEIVRQKVYVKDLKPALFEQVNPETGEVSVSLPEGLEMREARETIYVQSLSKPVAVSGGTE